MTAPYDGPAGEHCAECWAILSICENVHRNDDDGWAHDECPED